MANQRGNAYIFIDYWTINQNDKAFYIGLSVYLQTQKPKTILIQS